jgi:hypothetical protein
MIDLNIPIIPDIKKMPTLETVKTFTRTWPFQKKEERGRKLWTSVISRIGSERLVLCIAWWVEEGVGRPGVLPDLNRNMPMQIGLLPTWLATHSAPEEREREQKEGEKEEGEGGDASRRNFERESGERGERKGHLTTKSNKDQEGASHDDVIHIYPIMNY